MRCVLERVVTRTRFEKGQMVEIARQGQCRHREQENYSSEEEYSDEDEDSSNEEDSYEDDYRDKLESEGSSRISTTYAAASTTHAAAGAGDSPQEIGPVSEHVDDYNEVHDICGNLPGESKC